MHDMNAIVWLFPILFMLHDFEEIILVEAWRKRNKNELEMKKSRRLVFSGCNKTPAFSIGVAIEFLIFSLVALVSSWGGTYNFWYAMFLGFTIHLLGHCIINIMYKFYVPGVITSILFLPCSLYILYTTYQMLSLTITHVLLYCVIGTAAALLLISVLHSCMGKFEELIENFEQQV